MKKVLLVALICTSFITASACAGQKENVSETATTTQSVTEKTIETTQATEKQTTQPTEKPTEKPTEPPTEEPTEINQEPKEYTGIELAGKSYDEIMNILGDDYEAGEEFFTFAFSSEPIPYIWNEKLLPGFAFQEYDGKINGIAIKDGAKLNDSISSDMTYSQIADLIGDFDVKAVGGEWSLIYSTEIDGYRVSFCIQANDYLKQLSSHSSISSDILREADPSLQSIAVRPNN